MKWGPPSILPEDVLPTQSALNMKSIMGQLRGLRGQTVTNGSGADWRIVSPSSNRDVNGALLIQKKGLDPITRKPKWRTVSSFGADGVQTTSVTPGLTALTLSSPYTATLANYSWMPDGSVMLQGSVTINAAANGSTIATGLPAPSVTATFPVVTDIGTMTITVTDAGALVAGTYPGGSTVLHLNNVRYVPGSAYDMAVNGREPQQ